MPAPQVCPHRFTCSAWGYHHHWVAQQVRPATSCLLSPFHMYSLIHTSQTQDQGLIPPSAVAHMQLLRGSVLSGRKQKLFRLAWEAPLASILSHCGFLRSLGDSSSHPGLPKHLCCFLQLSPLLPTTPLSSPALWVRVANRGIVDILGCPVPCRVFNYIPVSTY